MKTTYVELYKDTLAGVLSGSGYETLEKARQEFADDLSNSVLNPVAILQVDVDEDNKVTVTQVPAEEPREYWQQYSNSKIEKLDADHPGSLSLGGFFHTIYVSNESGGLDVVTGDERAAVIKQYFE